MATNNTNIPRHISVITNADTKFSLREFPTIDPTVYEKGRVP